MADFGLRWTFSPDAYQTSDLPSLFPGSALSGVTIVPSAGPTAGRSSLRANNPNAVIGVPDIVTSVRQCAGYRIKSDSWYSIGGGAEVPLIVVNSDWISLPHSGLYMRPDGRLDLRRWIGGIFFSESLAISDLAVPTGAWQYIELLEVVDGTSGYLEARVNSQVYATYTGNTASAAAQTLIPTSVTFGTPTGAPYQFDMTDFYCGGGAAADFLGSRDFSPNVPISDTADNAWINSAGTSTANHTYVDDTTLDTTDYIEADTVGNVQSLGFAAIPTGDIAELPVEVWASLPNAGFAELSVGLRVGGTDYYHATPISPGVGFARYLRFWPNNPDTAAPWATGETYEVLLKRIA